MRVYDANLPLDRDPCAETGVGFTETALAQEGKPLVAALPIVNRLDFAIVSSPGVGGRYDICLEGAARRFWMG
jgi:hypothetical protein